MTLHRYAQMQFCISSDVQCHALQMQLPSLLLLLTATRMDSKSLYQTQMAHCKFMTVIMPHCNCVSVIMQIIQKIQIIPGDMSQADCGISIADQQKLVAECQYVIHSAASIRFDNPIQTDLQLSYFATKALADLATQVCIPNVSQTLDTP